MTEYLAEYQKGLIIALLNLSVLILVVPGLVFGIRTLVAKPSGGLWKKSGISRMLAFSACLIGAVWCLRYAVGYHAIVSPDTELPKLTWWEEIFNSMSHALQTFSMDEEYTKYILDGKQMLRKMFGEETVWQTVYGLYASVLNFIAPIAGGAIIFEILASIFPKIRLSLSYIAFWKDKYYFSEFNEASLALAKSIRAAKAPLFRKPVIIFTDVYADDENEKSSEMLQEAKWIGAICVRDDLSHVNKNRFGRRCFFLIDRAESGNLHTLADLANGRNCRYLKKAEIYLFTNDDAYVQVERRVYEKLSADRHFRDDKDLPSFIPVKSYRNLISNLLVDLPLYEPLIGKPKKEDGSRDLTVTILGTGHIGTEMFLSTYWFGQILDCNLKIHVLSQETEEAFWSKIDYVNPEIRHTTIPADPILKVNRKGDMAPVYCQVDYLQCDVKSSKFVSSLSNGDSHILDTDYFLVALGSDEDNVSVANTVKKYMGQHHLDRRGGRTVIAYVVYDSELSEILNRKRQFCHIHDRVDVYMRAVGCRKDVYSVRNVFLMEHEPYAQKVRQAYLSIQNHKQRAEANKKRMNDEYKHWADRARAMHLKYKVFSMGMIRDSVLDYEDPTDEKYVQAMEKAYSRYRKVVSGEFPLRSEQQKEAHIRMLHKIAWVEHRRWNAFTRIMGFRHTDDYDVYAVRGVVGSYKHMELKLHPCLVEADQKGIRAKISAKGVIDTATAFRCTDRSDFDLLDDLSYDLYEKELNDYNFKQYDYPTFDF